MGNDLTIVNAARVSFHKESNWEIDTVYGDKPHIFENIYVLKEQDVKIINYLAKHNHWSPFSHAFLSFRIKCPLFVRAQLIKHKIALRMGDEITSNEVSRRYVDDEPEFFFPDVWRGKPVNAKQGSDGIIDASPFWAHETVEDCLDLYINMLKYGVAPEQARMFLPQNTMTEFLWSGSLSAFARVCKLRLDPHAQKETQDIAKMINEQIPETFQHSWKALLGQA